MLRRFYLYWVVLLYVGTVLLYGAAFMLVLGGSTLDRAVILYAGVILLCVWLVILYAVGVALLYVWLVIHYNGAVLLCARAVLV